MRRRLPVLALIALLAVPMAGCSGRSSPTSAPTSAVSTSAAPDTSASDPDPDASARVDTSEPAADPSAAAALAKTRVGQLMKQLGCSNPQLVETDPLSTQTGMCTMSGDVTVLTFASDAKRDEWVAQAVTSGLATIVGPQWAVGVEVGTDAPTVVAKLGGKAN